jgi:hypothetical protein
MKPKPAAKPIAKVDPPKAKAPAKPAPKQPVEESKEPAARELTNEERAKIEKEMEVMMREFRTIPFLKLDNYLNASALNGKYVLLFDKTHKC